MSESAPEVDAGQSDTDPSDVTTTDTPTVGQYGFPEKTPWRQMSAEHQVAYWQHQAKKHETTAKTTQQRLAEVEPKAKQLEALDEANKTESQREIDRLNAELAAAKQQQAEARRTFGTQLVETRLSAAAAGKGMTGEALRTLAGDLSRFLKDDGIDGEAVDTFLAALPDKTATEQPSPPRARPDLGGGRRESAASTGLQRGRDLYYELHPKRKSQAA